jgi:hypothetical protein
MCPASGTWALPRTHMSLKRHDTNTPSAAPQLSISTCEHSRVTTFRQPFIIMKYCDASIQELGLLQCWLELKPLTLISANQPNASAVLR